MTSTPTPSCAWTPHDRLVRLLSRLISTMNLKTGSTLVASSKAVDAQVHSRRVWRLLDTPYPDRVQSPTTTGLSASLHLFRMSGGEGVLRHRSLASNGRQEESVSRSLIGHPGSRWAAGRPMAHRGAYVPAEAMSDRAIGTRHGRSTRPAPAPLLERA